MQQTTPGRRGLRCGLLIALVALGLVGELRANPPVASFIFPAGGQRGTTVQLRVGGLFLHRSCGFELLGPGVKATPRLSSIKTIWFEGPVLPLPDSQRQEDYPKDMAGTVEIAADSPLGLRLGRLWTSEGAASGLRFEVGDLPEMIEREIDGDTVPVAIPTPLTINGRIFPRENIDAYTFHARKGQTFTCTARAKRLGSPLDPHLEIRDGAGRVLTESAESAELDTRLLFTAPADGEYQVRIRDIGYQGGPAYVYRLTVTAEPQVERVHPLGGRRGATTQFTLPGTGMPTAPVAVAIPADAPEAFAYRHGSSDPILLDVDDLPEHQEAEPNDTPTGAPIPPPAVLNGRIDRPGDNDCWPLHLKKGEPVALELRAARLGSRLHGQMTLSDPTGKEVARGEWNGTTEPTLNFNPPADGTYVLRVADRFRARGGPEFGYRVRVAPPRKEPGFLLKVKSDVLTLPRAAQAKLPVEVERRGGFQGPITLTVEGLPAGVTVAGTTIAANQNAANLDFKADASAPIGPLVLKIHGEGMQEGKKLSATAHLPTARGEPAVEAIRAVVALPCPFKITSGFEMRLWSRGTVCRRKYKIERNGFDGPITVSLADKQARHLQGANGPALVVPSGVSEFEYPIFMPPWMETGRTCRVCVQAVGVVRENGVDHEVSFSATGQNDQIITVVETGRLEVAVERGSVLIAPGKTLPIPVRVSRSKGLAGPVRVELIVPEHMRGLVAEPITIAADQSAGTLSLRFAMTDLGPFNMPLVVRATVEEPTGPVVGETRLELLTLK